MASSNANFKSQDEFRRQKELEEARKAGLAEPEKDEEGKEINPHIPQYMTNAPWYLNSDKPSLKHQRNWNKKDTAGATWYDRGQKVFQAKKYRKGACMNCGAMTHASKDCLERPRKVGAKWTNKFIAADEKVETIAMDSWDGKRDRWNGYDERDHARVVERFEVLEKARQEQRRQEEMQRRYTTDEKRAEGEVDTQLDDEDKIDDAQDAGFSEVKKRVRTTAGGSTGTVRNLRIREDTAKYLYNLDVNSAHYDPKSRSMREDPNPGKPLGDDKPFAGDNFVRKTGDYAAWQSLTVHQIQANDRGHELHVQAAPSQAEALFQQFKQKKDKLQVSSKKCVLDKYGNAASADRLDQEELFGQTERYEEYDRTGRLIKGKEEKVRSRYEEDVYINNHTSVWGSFWKDGQWGYSCCHQTDKNSYCTGQRGKEAASRQEQVMMRNLELLAATQGSEAVEQEKLRRAEASKLNGYKGPHEELWGSEAATAAV